MHGSQFHCQMALSTIRPETLALKALSKHPMNNDSKPTSRKGFLLSLLAFTLITLSLSNLALAGSSQPKLKGGNGNANGR